MKNNFKKLNSLFVIIILIVIIFGQVNVIAAEQTKQVRLTTEEIQFIEDHPIIYMGVDKSFMNL